MLRDVLEFLICPHCGAGFSELEQTVRCRRGHAFDIARQGYVNLSFGDAGAGTGDTAAMVAARARFLDAGHFEPLAGEVGAESTRALAEGPPGCVVDVGAGTGWHLGRVLDRFPDRRGLALDVSPYALRRAARAHPRAGAVGCDVWRGLPVRDGAAALALDIFAPRKGEELARILHSQGTLLVVSPTPRHLAELVPTLGLLSVDQRKQERLDHTLGPHLVRTRQTVHEHSMTPSRADILALATMGPSAWHHDGASLETRVSDLPESMRVTASVTLSTYRHP